MKPLQYGPYNILKHIGENTFQLDIPACLSLHPIFNVDLLRPYYAPLLEQNELQTAKLERIPPYVQEPLLCDTIMVRRICHTRTKSIPLFQVAKVG